MKNKKTAKNKKLGSSPETVRVIVSEGSLGGEVKIRG